jgi:hypothetical protein
MSDPVILQADDFAGICDPAILLQLAPPTSDPAPDPPVPDATLITAAGTAALSELWTYLGAGGATKPQDTSNLPDLRRMLAVVGLWNLYKMQPERVAQLEQGASKHPARVAYESVIAECELIAKGQAVPAWIEALIPQDAQPSTGGLYVSNAPVFTPCNYRGA